MVESGDWTVTGGALKAGTNTVQSYGNAYIANNWTNYAVEGRIQFSSADAYGGGIGGRLEAANGAHYAAWVYPAGLPGLPNVLRLIKFQSWTNFGYNGSTNVAMEGASLEEVGTNWQTVKLAFHGDQIGVYYNSNQVMSVRDTEAESYSGGGISVDMWAHALSDTMSVDEVVVRPLVMDDSYSGTMDLPLNVAAPGVLGNDTGVYATELVAESVSWPTNGTLNLSTNGGFTYAPATDYQGTDSFSYRVRQGSNDLGQAMVTIEVVMPQVPVIVRAPLSRTNEAGTTAVFSVGAVGTPSLGYQWYWNGTNLSDRGKVNGARTDTLTISNVLAGDAGSFTVVVSNALGSATSAPPAMLTVTLSTAPDGTLFSDDFDRLADPGPLAPWVAESGNWTVTGGVLDRRDQYRFKATGYVCITNMLGRLFGRRAGFDSRRRTRMAGESAAG